MKLGVLLFFAAACFGASPACAQISSFQHIVLIVQENRTPDNLFYALCDTKPCSTHPDSTQYDIQTSNWLTKGGYVQPQPVPLWIDYDLGHRHADFLAMCDLDATATGKHCKMDGAADAVCRPVSKCPPDAQFKYVDNLKGAVAPYVFLATQYGWANYMFQTNQGPSFPAHQFLFGATSAPSRKDDHAGTFAAENLGKSEMINGCIAPPDVKVQLIDARGNENPNNRIYPCFEHKTLADLLDARHLSWRYYTPGAGDLWTAPDAIDHICQPKNNQCTGPLWVKNVALHPLDAVQDIKDCNLRAMSWVIPSAQFSDHAGSGYGSGPAWVATVVNAIGNSPCRNLDGSSYWDTTAIVIVWDDWGGWYDHEPPTFLPFPEGGYQYGFRVPMIFVSAYTPQGYINNLQQDFGSIVRFVEYNFGISMGDLSFADARTIRNLAQFYDFSTSPRSFQTVPASSAAAAALLKDEKGPLLPPDDD